MPGHHRAVFWRLPPVPGPLLPSLVQTPQESMHRALLPPVITIMAPIVCTHPRQTISS